MKRVMFKCSSCGTYREDEVSAEQWDTYYLTEGPFYCSGCGKELSLLVDSNYRMQEPRESLEDY